MAGHSGGFSMIPYSKIKVEVSDDDDETSTATCSICNKTFASDMALNNHARMEHTDAYSTGDSANWTVEPGERRKTDQEWQKHLIQKRTQELISSMVPTDMSSLASEDVSYIIIKAEDSQTISRKRRAGASEKTAGTPRKEKDREVRPITGPFECLQPSVLVADGTCHQIFFSCCEYSAHFRDEHTRRRKGLRCQVCEKPLSGGDDLAPFPCEVCGEGFQNNKDLSQHMATDHVKLKPFECGVCHKRFTQQGGVQQHMRMHTGDRPFSCTFCPKAFTQKSGLDQHLRIHTKVKPYRCVVCSKTFCQSVHLRQHMRTHTNVSPFQCGICQKRFKQSSHLNYHLKNHNPLNMTEEQKSVYKKLVSIMNDDEAAHTRAYDDRDSATLTYGEMDADGRVEVVVDGEHILEEHDMDEIHLQDSVEAEVLLDEEEQLLAEQSIQLEDAPETYILTEHDEITGM